MSEATPAPAPAPKKEDLATDPAKWLKLGGGSLVGALLAAYAWGADISEQLGELSVKVSPLPRAIERLETLEQSRAASEANLAELSRRLDRIDAANARILDRIDALAARREK